MCTCGKIFQKQLYQEFVAHFVEENMKVLYTVRCGQRFSIFNEAVFHAYDCDFCDADSYGETEESEEEEGLIPSSQ